MINTSWEMAIMIVGQSENLIQTVIEANPKCQFNSFLSR